MTNDFLPFYKPDMTGNEADFVKDSLLSGWVSTGPKVKEFSQKLKELLGAEDVLPLNSCTAGLHLGLKALDIGPGDEVITTPLTFAATSNVIEHVGATPVLADINPETFQIAPDKISEKISQKTAAIMPVHFAGQLVDRSAIKDICKNTSISILEDGAHLFPTKEFTGPIEDLISFSFYANKNISTTEGGLLAGPKKLISKVRDMALHGLSKDAWKRFDKAGSWKYDVEFPGFKYNMTDIQAAVGLSQLERIEEFKQKRIELYELYESRLAEVEEIRMMKIENIFSYHILSVVLDPKCKVSRDQFIEELKKRGVGTSVHYIPLYNFSYYQNKYHWNPEDYPGAESVTRNNLTLPLFTRMSVDDVHRVVDTIKEILK